jgi:hypothetical protein
MSFDTESNTKPSRESAQTLKQIQSLIGLKFTVTLSPRGEIISVEIPETTSAALQKLPESLALRELFTATRVQELIGPATVVLPENELSVDSNWETVDTSRNPFGTFTRTRIYKLEGISQQNNSEIAVITLATTLTPENAATPASATQSTAKPISELISFEEAGSLKFDINEGFFQSAETRSTTLTEVPYSETKIETVTENSTSMTITKL